MNKIRAIGERVGGLLRRPRTFFAAALPIAIPLLLASVSHPPEFGTTSAASAVAPSLRPSLRYDELAAPARAELPEHSVILTFEPNDTLDGVLVAGGLTRGESATLTRELARFVDVRRLRPGHLVRFHYSADNHVDAVQMKMTGWGEIEALRNGAGFDVIARPANLREIDTAVSATIDTSLYEALRAGGETPQLVQQIVDVFQWDIDFFELKKGDSFNLIVKKKYANDELVGYGPITAARVQHDGVTYEAFRYEYADGRAGYYARAGTPLRKQFLRAPLKFTRVTSGFSKRRFHPVLHYFRPHYGVDYGAPVGTPVMTTADGVVVEAGLKGGEGNFIRIRHTSRIDTCYLHLSRFAKGLKRGTRVTQGEVIGYVGMTGLATGPHLDYRVNDDGKWLDPLKLRSITSDPLGGESLRRFRASVATIVPRLEQTQLARVAEPAPRRRALF